jgi:peptidoglycan/LPS O-acetylase OafA/YrhL
LPISHAALESNEIWQEKAYLPGMAAIAMGVLGALIAARIKPPQRWVVTTLGVVGAAGLASILLVEDILWPLLKDDCLLLLTLSVMCLLVSLRWREGVGSHRPLRGFGWLRSFGRLSYEIYLTHMFVVYAVARIYKAYGGDIMHAWLWYVPAVPLCWLLGWMVARWFSIPCDRVLRERLLSPSRQAEDRNLLVADPTASESG